MLKFTMAASLLAMTLSVDAFAGKPDEESQRKTTPTSLQRWFPMTCPTGSENHTRPSRELSEDAAHVIQFLGKADDERLNRLRAMGLNTLFEKKDAE